MKVKQAFTAGLLVLTLGSSGCLGPDHAYGSIKQWNAQLAEQDWINEIVFVGLWFIPVYPIALAADVLVFNTVRYWSGDDMISDPGAFQGMVKD